MNLEGTGSGPVIGVFGAGLPRELMLAGGAIPIDVECLPAGALPPALDDLVEPFVDARVRRVLTQLAGGDLDGLSGLVFCRDDPVGHIAYIYALELRRQGLVPARPSFFLWNLVHRDEQAAYAFNLVQAASLETFLVASGGGAFSPSGIATTIGKEDARRAARQRLIEAIRDGRVSGSDGFALWREGGRLDAADHVARIDAALQSAPERRAASGPRIGLVGSPVLDPGIYRALERHGRIVADPHPAGLCAVPPAPSPHDDPLAAILRAEASNPFSVRRLPVAHHVEAIAQSCIDARCELVVIQFDENDDHVGWDAPRLRRMLREAGIACADLGFLPRDEVAIRACVDAAFETERSRA